MASVTYLLSVTYEDRRSRAMSLLGVAKQKPTQTNILIGKIMECLCVLKNSMLSYNFPGHEYIDGSIAKQSEQTQYSLAVKLVLK